MRALGVVVALLCAVYGQADAQLIPSYWVMQGPVYNMAAYGAAGDVTSDTAAISAIIAAMPSTGGTIFFPAYTTVGGSAVSNYVLPPQIFTKPVSISCSSPAQVSIIDNTVKALAGSPWLEWVATSQVLVQNCTFDATGLTIATAAEAEYMLLPVSVTDWNFIGNVVKMAPIACVTNNCTNSFGIYSEGPSSAITISNNSFIEAATNAPNQNEAIANQSGSTTSGEVISGNTITNTGTEMAGATGLLFTSNTITGACYGAGSSDGTGGSNVYSGNTIVGCGAGRDGNGFNRTGLETYGSNDVIANNIVSNNSGSGIYLYGQYDSVTGNVSTNNAQGSTGFAGVEIDYNPTSGANGSHATITGNTLGDSQGSPTQSWGILDASTVTGLTGISVYGNHFVGNISGPLGHLVGGSGPGLNPNTVATTLNDGLVTLSPSVGSGIVPPVFGCANLACGGYAQPLPLTYHGLLVQCSTISSASCTVTNMSPPFTNTVSYACSVTGLTSPGIGSKAISTTSVVLSMATAATTSIQAMCWGY